MKKLRWGLLSTARINRSLIPPLKASPRNELAAVASRSAAQAQSYAAEWGIPEAHGSYEDLLADPSIDVLYNPLPNHLHASWTIRAAEAGKHVLCEKPLALSVAEVDAIEAAARANTVVVAEAFMYRHHPRTMQVRQRIQSGEIGALQLIRGGFTFPLSDPDNVRWDPEMGGGGLWDVGCYPLSFARYVVGQEPLEVFGQQVTGPTGVDVSFTALLRFPGDILCQFDAGIRSPFRMEMSFVGSEGIMNLPVPFKPTEQSEILIVRGEEEERIPVSGPSLYLGEIEDLADAVLSGTPSRVTLSDSRNNIAVLTALFQSARENRPIPLG